MNNSNYRAPEPKLTLRDLREAVMLANSKICQFGVERVRARNSPSVNINEAALHLAKAVQCLDLAQKEK